MDAKETASADAPPFHRLWFLDFLQDVIVAKHLTRDILLLVDSSEHFYVWWGLIEVLCRARDLRLLEGIYPKVSSDFSQ